ncbi:MAG: tyrosine-type recombinase/integrase [Nitrospinota bacterium]
MTVDAWAGQYLAIKSRADCRDMDVRRAWVRCFCRSFGHQALGAIDGAQVFEWRQSLEARCLKPNTIRSAMAYISNFFTEAVRAGLAGQNPARGIGRPRAEKRRRFLDQGEAERLRRASPPWLSRFIGLGLETGFRPGELMGLRWPNVDFQLELISLGAAESKNGRGRDMPMTPDAEEILRAARAAARNGYVLTGPHGEQISKDKLLRAFRKAALAAGLEDVTPHVLRHTFASWMAQSGESLYLIGQLLGHASPETTQRYAHLAHKQLRAALIRGLHPPKS